MFEERLIFVRFGRPRVSEALQKLAFNLRGNVLGRSKSFFRFIRKQWMHNIFHFILFYRITYDPFCSIKIKITTFDRLDFTFL